MVVHDRLLLGGRPDRDQDLQLARHALAREPLVPRALYFCLGFIALFTMGGLSVMLAAYPVDYQARLLLRRRPLPLRALRRHRLRIFAGTYYWFPKITGRMYDERLAQLHFWLMFVGFNAAFLPQHMLGLMGMPRRVYTYDREGSSSGTT